MSFIPKNANWYLADIVEEIRVGGDRKNVVHTNQVLVRADSPEEAYKNAIALGKRGNTKYWNPKREDSHDQIPGAERTECPL
jgi:hypothetical protein